MSDDATNTMDKKLPLPVQQLVCNVCGHPLEKIEWNQVESCPKKCEGSHPVTFREYTDQNLLKILESTIPTDYLSMDM